MGEEFADANCAAPGNEDAEDKEDGDEIPGHSGMRACFCGVEQEKVRRTIPAIKIPRINLGAKRK